MLALKNDGTIYAWGKNDLGQLGLGDSGADSGASVFQVKAPGGPSLFTGAAAIAAGDQHSVALSADGSMWAWGRNDYYQLGASTGSPCVDVINFHHLCGVYPTQVRGAGGVGLLSNVGAIAAGGQHSLALTQQVSFNDNFANASPVAVSPGAVVGPINGSTRLATVEPGEPLHPGDAACFIIPGHVYTNTVWFKVTPSASGELYASTANPGTNFDTVLALYTGAALNNLSLVACDNNGDTESSPGSTPLWSSILHAQVQAGQTYYLQLGGVGGATSGEYALMFRLTTPTVSVAPSSLSFGSVLVGTTSPAQTVTLTNTSRARMSIGSISSTPEFSRTTNCPLSPATLAGGASCTINLTYTPSASGTRSGTLSLASNATGNPHTVGLSGSGTLPAAPQVSLAPSSLSFGSISVGSISPAQTATLTNTGNAALSITSIMASGDFSESDTCPLSPA